MKKKFKFVQKKTMIQRIQTIYILLAEISIALIFALPLADIVSKGEVFLFKATGIFNGEELVISGLPLLVLLGIILLMHVAAIFMYKKRIRQIRILVFTIILMLGLFGIFYYFGYASFEEQTIAFNVTVAFPLAAIIIDYLAIRAIGKDEALVKSMDRIR